MRVRTDARDTRLRSAPRRGRPPCSRRAWLSASVAGALAADLVLECFSGTPGAARWILLGRGWPMLALGTTLLWIVIVGLGALIGRLRLAVILVLDGAILLAAASAAKVTVRNDPLVPADLYISHEAGFLSSMAPRGAVIWATGLIVAVDLTVWTAARLLRPRLLAADGRRSTHSRARRATMRAAVVLVCIALLGPAAWFPSTASPWRRLYDAASPTWSAWDQPMNYRTHGFIGGFLYNLPGPVMQRPAGYDRTTMLALAQRYAARAAELNATRNGHALDRVNVVQILSESFSDTRRLRGVTLGEDPIPYTRALMSRTASGGMVSPVYGGGTANVAFEELTGLSTNELAPQMTVPYEQLIDRFSHFPSATDYFSSSGIASIAIHPFNSGIYRRGTVLPILGFSQFIDINHVTYRSRIDHNPYVSDKSAFGEVELQLRNHSGPLFIHLVTIQNHFPMANIYERPWPSGQVKGKNLPEVAGYLRGVNYSDIALRGLIQDLRRSPERTVVLFYGDHLPGIWPRSVIRQNSDLTMHTTPYFIWSNFQPFTFREDPPISPIYLIPRLLDEVGAPVTPFYALLHDLQHEIPSMSQGLYRLPDGREVTEKDLPSSARALLQDYRLFEYDVTSGHSYVVDKMTKLG